MVCLNALLQMSNLPCFCLGAEACAAFDFCGGGSEAEAVEVLQSYLKGEIWRPYLTTSHMVKLY